VSALNRANHFLKIRESAEENQGFPYMLQALNKLKVEHANSKRPLKQTKKYYLSLAKIYIRPYW
jgi:hypothetical protein